MSKIKIWLDMDGTIANLYGIKGWLPMLEAHDPTPYAEALPMVNMSALARLLNNRQREGYAICVVSALSKNSTPAYDRAVKFAKMRWLKRHLPSVHFDEIKFVPYTFVKNNVNNGHDILIDDEARHLEAWTGTAIHASQILESLHFEQFQRLRATA